MRGSVANLLAAATMTMLSSAPLKVLNRRPGVTIFTEAGVVIRDGRKGPGWTHAQVQRMAKKKRNQARNRRAQR